MVGIQQTLDALDDTLQEMCHSEKIPGMAMMVSQDGERIFEKMYGYRDKEKQLPVTPDTLFGVASITKSVAALAIMQLVDAGKLSVEDPVVEWLPEFKLPDSTYTKHVTIHHLLTHTAGLPGLPAVHQARAESIKNDPDGEYLFGDMPYTDRPVKSVVDLIESLSEMDFSLLGKPGDVFNYSNECYALLQKIIEKASGESFISYVDSQILHPLQMNRSVFLNQELTEKENVTELYAYTKDNERKVFHSPAWWDVGEIYANGSLKASAYDLMSYLEVYRLKGRVNGAQIVSDENIRKMTIPQITLPNGIQYGYGLQIRERAGIRFIGHGGSIKGVSSNMQVALDKGLTVCVLMNIADADAEGIAFLALDQLLGIQDDEVLPDYPLTKDELEKYKGYYRTDEGHEAHLCIRDNRLYLKLDSSDVALRPYAANSFVMPSGKKVTFTVDDQRQITGIFRGMRWLPKI